MFRSRPVAPNAPVIAGARSAPSASAIYEGFRAQRRELTDQLRDLEGTRREITSQLEECRLREIPSARLSKPA